MSGGSNGGVCLPRPSSFSPRLRIVAWSDTASIRKKLMYGGSTVSLASSHSHDISYSSKSVHCRPQTIPYRPKSGTLSSRPCSAPAMYRRKEPVQTGNVSMNTLNLQLPETVPNVKPASAFQPKIPPKKQFPVWYSGDLASKSPSNPSSAPGVRT